MAWSLMVPQCVAHIEPSLANGTIATGFPIGNIRTMDPNIRAKFDAGGAAAAQFRFDRGAGLSTNQGVTCAAFINHNLGTKADPVAVYAGATAGATTDTLYSATPSDDKPIFTTFTNNTGRHIRVDVGNPTETGFEIGCFLLGRYEDLGNPVFPETWSGLSASVGPPGVGGVPSFTGPMEGARTVQAVFRNVSTTIAHRLIFQWQQQYLTLEGGSSYWAMGGGGGANPMLLIDGDSRAYYGTGVVSAQSWGAALAEVTVSITEMPYWRRFEQ